MAKLNLSTKVTLDITDNGKKIDSFEVTYRKPTRKQEKKIGADNKEIIEVFQKGLNLIKRTEVLESKVEALKELGKNEELLKAVNKLETLYKQQSEYDDKFEELGGADKLMEASKLQFNIAVGGKDKDRLAEWIEDNAEYAEVLDTIAKDALEQQGKHL